ncbi:MAG: molybdopterin-dependent oxidoreductase [Kiritimatiellae bacterium]|nr:molybdopterin-dependent oxidoreductase [Kiritimatiellia bacterium]MDD4341752.1 molybdopterin-dependent oxidoreductase [Kiritimatiellia bacterium]
MSDNPTANFKQVHHSVTKIDAKQLALGKDSYVGDLAPREALIVKMLWSPHPHARITSINVSKAEKMPGVKAVLWHGNVPRNIHCTAGQGYPEPSPYDTFIFDTKVRHVGDRVAAVAAETAEQAEAALKKITVKYELLEPVFTIDEAMAEDAPIIHDEPEAYVPIPIPYDPKKNLVAMVGCEAGDFDQGMQDADFTFDDTYETPYAQHCPIEPYTSLAHVDSAGRIVITTSTQVPFHCRRIVAQALGLPVQKIRVIKPRIGGGFGSKQEILLEDIVALVALRTGRPAFWQFTREENFITGRTRHPIRVRLRAGIKKDGTITAIGMDCWNNTGAYGGHGLTVVSCCGSKVLPLYRCDNIHFDGKVLYTNLPVGGAYRGFGATQAFFAMESTIDKMADAIGMDPLEFRRQNHIQSGDSSPIFAALGEGKEGTPMTIDSCALDDCIAKGAEAIGWDKRTDWRDKTGRYRRGIGMACLMQGSSIPHIDMGGASIKINEDGSFNLLVGATDLGTGSDTVLAQIAAEELATTTDKMIVYSSDTDMTPFDVGAYASSTTYLSGEASRKAAADAKRQILKTGAEILGLPVDQVQCVASHVQNTDGSQKVSYGDIACYALYSKNQYQIIGTGSHFTEKSPPPFAAHYAEIEVDTWTGLIRVLQYVSTIDCGTAINPALCEGQTEGGTLNGISYALTEQYLFTNGRMTNPSFAEYHIFSMRDKPPIKAILVPSYEHSGPFGAKSVSEICINGPAPVFANAIYNATGARLYEFPFMPEKVLKAIQAVKA